MKTLTDTIDVVVTLQHIATRAKNEPQSCAVYLALTEAGYDEVYVDREWVDFGEVRYVAPPELTDWLKRFDRGEIVESERFRLSRDVEPRVEPEELALVAS